MKSFLRKSKASKSTLRLVEAIVEGRDRRRNRRFRRAGRGLRGFLDTNKTEGQ